MEMHAIAAVIMVRSRADPEPRGCDNGDIPNRTQKHGVTVKEAPDLATVYARTQCVELTEVCQMQPMDLTDRKVTRHQFVRHPALARGSCLRTLRFFGKRLVDSSNTSRFL